MKCPHCDYMHGTEWIGEVLENIEGDAGRFFELPVKLERRVYHEMRQAQLMACPSCLKTFIEK